jgi:hypothetical protein
MKLLSNKNSHHCVYEHMASFRNSLFGSATEIHVDTFALEISFFLFFFFVKDFLLWKPARISQPMDK